MPYFAVFRRLFAPHRATDAASILDRAVKGGALRVGPPAIAAARAQCRDRPDLIIAPLETRFGMIGGRIAVKAWFLISEDSGSAELREVARRSIEAIGKNGRMADVFYLSAAYGIPNRDIAVLLGISERNVRRLLVEAIARIDRNFGDHAAAPTPSNPIGSTS